MLVMQDLGSDSGMRLIWLVGGKAHWRRGGPASEWPDWEINLHCY